MAKVEAEVKPDTADYLRREASNRGIPVEQFAGGLLEQAIAGPADIKQALTPEQKLKLLDELIRKQDPNIPPIPLDALSRESIYDEDE